MDCEFRDNTIENNSKYKFEDRKILPKVDFNFILLSLLRFSQVDAGSMRISIDELYELNVSLN